MYSGKMTSLNQFFFNNCNIINAVWVLDVIYYHAFSMCSHLLFCYLRIFFLFLCCLCNWPYSCCASQLITYN
jgi:hypothetical protein